MVQAYHSDAKIVLIGEGRPLRSGFDWRRASMPALAAVSPNREMGPMKQSNSMAFHDLDCEAHLGIEQAQFLDNIASRLLQCAESWWRQ